MSGDADADSDKFGEWEGFAPPVRRATAPIAGPLSLRPSVSAQGARVGDEGTGWRGGEKLGGVDEVCRGVELGRDVDEERRWRASG